MPSTKRWHCCLYSIPYPFKKMFLKTQLFCIFSSPNLCYDQGTKGFDMALAAGKTLPGENN